MLSNTDRSFGTIFGSEITRKYYNNLDDDTFTVDCNGVGRSELWRIHSKGTYT